MQNAEVRIQNLNFKVSYRRYIGKRKIVRKHKCHRYKIKNAEFRIKTNLVFLLMT